MGNDVVTGGRQPNGSSRGSRRDKNGGDGLAIIVTLLLFALGGFGVVM